MAAAGSTALTDKSGGSGSLEAFHDDGPAIFANSQDDRDLPAAQMTGLRGRFFKPLPEALQDLPQGLHD
jgi:hypothetical protein